MKSAAQRERARRMRASPNFRDGEFQNPVPTRVVTLGELPGVLAKQLSGKQQRVPPGPLPLHFPTPAELDRPPASGVRAIWLGHSTMILELEHQRILIDPVWSERSSPARHVGPKRFHPPPVALDALPPLDAVLISHDHYDHLDKHTVLQLAARGARFVTSLGVGGHLERWGIDPTRVLELDWGERTDLGGVRVTATPARHFSGRRPFRRNRTLWSSWVFAGARFRVFFTGDTGFFDGLADIGREHGPFDLTLVKIAAYSESWPDIHLFPEDSIRLHQMVRGERMLPIHWATFNLAFHAWDEPAERALAAAREAGVELLTPRIGEPVDPMAPAAYGPWWREVRAAPPAGRRD